MIKLFATDMDGTWLTDHQTYDHALFEREFAIMKEKDIKFVVASGNQFENLLTRFPRKAQDMFFVAENGALVAQGHQILHMDSLSDEEFAIAKKAVEDYGYPGVVEGLTSAYIRKKDGPAFLKEMKKYYFKIELVDDFEEINDRIFKVNMTLPVSKTLAVIAQLKNKYPAMGFVAGSADSIDMQTKGMNKATGLAYLSQKLGIKPQEMVAFGDSGNDVGMLNYAGRSYVTANAMKEAKQAADQIIGSCNDSAVQKKILTLLA